MQDITQPGVHWMQPFVTEVVALRVTPETKTLDPMICTTRDGVRNVFRDVQVRIFCFQEHALMHSALQLINISGRP